MKNARHLFLTILAILILGFINVSVSNTHPTYERVIEEPIQRESWMTQPFFVDDTALLVEEPIEMETWMTKPFV